PRPGSGGGTSHTCATWSGAPNSLKRIAFIADCPAWVGGNPPKESRFAGELLSSSPPRSRFLRQRTVPGPAGERAGVRGRESLGAAFPLTPSLSPATWKWGGVLLHFDRGGEGVARRSAFHPFAAGGSAG